MPDDATWSIEVPITKASGDDERTVYGWASMSADANGNPVVDMDGDLITPNELRKAAHGFMLASRDAGVEHADYGPHIGQVVESVVMTPDVRKAMGVGDGPTGWFIGMRVNDPEIWKAVKAGEYSAFSIGGSGTRTPVQE